MIRPRAPSSWFSRVRGRPFQRTATRAVTSKRPLRRTRRYNVSDPLLIHSAVSRPVTTVARPHPSPEYDDAPTPGGSAREDADDGVDVGAEVPEAARAA